MPQSRREGSVELGEGDFAIKYNKNGRPIRKSAGQKMSPDVGFVDSGAIDQQLLEMDDLSESESDFDSEAEREALKKKPKKRKRTPSPTPPPLSPLPPPDLPSADEESPEPFSLEEHNVPAQSIEPIHLTFHIEKGFSGPLHVQLNIPDLTRSGAPLLRITSSSMAGPPTKKRKIKSLPKEPHKEGFLSLPPELRNEVYRMVFKVEKKIDFVEATNMSRSSAFLRTCKQIQAEGSSVLYGSNQFYFGRNKEMRRPFWNAERKEIGYKDLRLFLDLIGPTNVSHLRDFWLCFDDAAPSAVPHLKRSEERRYVHDTHLVESLKVLAQHAQLEKLTLTFWGRRGLALTDNRFLHHLCKIKADVFDIKNPTSETYSYFSWQQNRIHEDTKQMIRKEIVRKTKLYDK